MKQLLVKQNWEEGKCFILSPKASRYLAKVRRVKVGDELSLLCLDGLSCLGQVLSIDNGDVMVKMLPPLEVVTSVPAMRIALFQSLLKGKKVDGVVRQAVEGGVSSVSIFKAEHSTFVLSQDKVSSRLERWQKIAEEAAQQSGNQSLFDVQYSLSLKEQLDSLSGGGLVFHEKSVSSISLHEAIDNIFSGFKEPIDSSGEADEKPMINVFIGPEGGFSDKELELFLARGYYPVWMGPSVLRAETAAVAAVSSVSILILEKEKWCLAGKKK